MVSHLKKMKDKDRGWAKLISQDVITSLHVTESILRPSFFPYDI